MWCQHQRKCGHRNGEHDECFAVGGPGQRFVDVLGGVEPVKPRRLHSVDGAVVPEDLASGRRGGAHYGAPDQPQTHHANGRVCHPSRLAYRPFRPTSGWCRLLVKLRRLGLPLAHMGAQRAPAQGQAADTARRLRRCRRARGWQVELLGDAQGALNSLSAAETELRELRSAGAVFGLLDVDDEFFVIVRPAPAGTRLLLSDATAALDYDIAAEVLEKLDNDIPLRSSKTQIRSRRAISGCCRTSACRRRCWASSSTSPTCTPTSSWAGSRARWASPMNCRRCSTVWVGDSGRRADQSCTRSRTGRRPSRRADRGGDRGRRRHRTGAGGQHREELGDPTAHAEILALRAAAAVLGDGWRLEGRRWR